MNSSESSSLKGCEVDLYIGERLREPSPVAVAALIFTITAVLNALVMIAVKTNPD